jgi:DNA-binding SARP family transcriptional activator
MGRQANLRVQVLGVLAVAVDGREVPPKELASRKGRTLLKLLLARRGEVVPADVLVEALWATRPPADPDANLATLVSRLRAVLGPEVIAADRQGWRFVAGPWVEVDLEEAARLAGEAEAQLAGEPARALAAAERALALLGRGPFLADEPDADWAGPAGGRAAGRQGQAPGLGRRLAVGDHARALAHADAATTTDPLDEAAWRAVMAAHAAAGGPAAALAAYERLRHTLVEELGTDPAPESQAPHLAILRADPVAGGPGRNLTRRPQDPPSPQDPPRPPGPAPAPAPAAPAPVDSREYARSGSATLPLRGAEPGPGSVQGVRARKGSRPPSQASGWGPRAPGPPSQASAWGPTTPPPPTQAGAQAPRPRPPRARSPRPPRGSTPGSWGGRRSWPSWPGPGRRRWAGGRGWCWSPGRPGSARPGW